MRRCIFCFKELTPEKTYSDGFDVFVCRGCRLPDYDTLYRQLYWKGQDNLLMDLTIVDNFAVRRQFNDKIEANNYSIIYRHNIEAIYLTPDQELRTLNNPACRLSYIAPLNVGNLESFKHKLTTWITFS